MPRDFDDDRDEREVDRPRRRRDYDDAQPPKKKTNLPLILGIVGGVVVLVCGGGIVALFFAIGKVRESAARQVTSLNGRQLAIASEMINDTQGGLAGPFASNPPTKLFGPRQEFTPPSEMSKRLSWRVDLLPYMERADIHRGLDYSEAWDSPANLNAANTLIKTFNDPADTADNQTRFRCFYDNGALWDTNPTKRTPLNNIPDGPANTILFVETADRVPWAQCNELKFDPNGNPPALGHPTRDVFLAAMADGSVRWVKKSISPATLKAAIHASDGPPGADFPLK
jgi:hypothetical protein